MDFLVALTLPFLSTAIPAAFAPRPPSSLNLDLDGDDDDDISAFGASLDLNRAYNPSWMSLLPDSASLSSISIPGTHDTMAWPLIMSPFAQCQNHDLSTQLTAGIRYIDIRLRNINGELYTVHKFVLTGKKLGDVLSTVDGFLEENPSEGVVMRVKKDDTDVGTDQPFKDVFEACVGGNNRILRKAGGFTVIPTVGEMRGRILLLTEFPGADVSWGITWNDPALVDLEDDWQVDSLLDIEKKWRSIVAHLDKTAASPDDGKMYMTHTSGGSLAVFPRVVAVGDGLQKGMNSRTLQMIMRMQAQIRGEKKKVGVVIMDFPGKELVEVVIGMNGM